MAATVLNSLQMTIISTEDSTSNVLVNRSVAPSLDENIATFVSYAKTTDLLAHDIVFPLPETTVSRFYIRNLAPALGGSILVSIKPFGGVLFPAVILGPGDVFTYWPASTAAAAIAGIAQGIAQIQVQASAALIPFEYFLGA